MPPPQASERLYTTLQRLQVVLTLAGRRAWSRMLPGNLDGSWSGIAAPLVQITSAAQLAAATAATAYVPAVLEETGQPDEPEAAVRPQVFAGVSSDGRSLFTALEGAVRTAKARVAAGASPERALIGGGAWLEQALQTAVTDAARDATATQIAVRQHMGWVRMVNPPCCSRCAVLAGKWYRWNDGFLRHPRCDCIHIPAAENVADDFLTDPEELVRRELITDLTPAQLRRIREGDDLVKVLNESRDAWRQRMAIQRKAEKARLKRLATPAGWGAGQQLPPGGVQDFMSHLTSRVQALEELRKHGIAE